jgi:GMP synthase (glutamine-hydrolysing)
VILVFENEVDPESRYFVPEIERQFAAAGVPVTVVPYAAAEEPPASFPAAVERLSSDAEGADGGADHDPSDVDGVVLSGSTAGVYETGEYPWIRTAERLVRDLRDRRVPTLGVCFGHQLVNRALGGSVEHRGLHTGIESVTLGDDPLFAGVAERVPTIHGDFVTELGDGMTRIGTADYYDRLASRHETAPLWTVQYHPEFTERLLPKIERDFGWPESAADRAFGAVSVEQTFENFAQLAREWDDTRE